MRIVRTFVVVAWTLAVAPLVCAQAASKSGGVAFPPGVLTVVEPTLDRLDAISLHDVVELRANKNLAWDPYSTTNSRTLYEMAKDAPYPQQVWCLEFAFKPLRMIEVDVPASDGRLQRKLIWYMVYRVRNTGAGLKPEVQPDGSFVTEAASTEPIRFRGQFTLVSQDRDRQGQRIRKAYLDRLIPAAIEPIRQRELPGGELKSSIEIAQHALDIESGRMQRGVWGVAMWESVDPEMDFFSVFVAGLTNAYKWTDPAGSYAAGDAPGKGRQFARKMLQLNFWRPGDEIEQDEREIRLGAAPGQGALYDSGEGVAYRWVYR